MVIKILGIGCPNCQRLEAVTHEALAETGVEASVEKVTDMDGIMAYELISTPGLVIDEQVVSAGRIPARETIKEWILRAAGK